MNEAWLMILGSSGGTPSSRSWPPSILLFYHGLYLILDAGEGAQIRLIENGIGPGKIDAIAVSHLHGDHIFGLPGLIESMSLTSRKRDLKIIGPAGIKLYLERVFEITNFTPLFNIVYSSPLSECELTSGKAVLTIKGFETCHSMESYGYIITGYKHFGAQRRKLFKIAYTGDTSVCEKTLNALRNEGDIDLLIHDSTFGHDKMKEAKHYGHSTAADAAYVAKLLNVKALILFHISPRYEDGYIQLLSEARSIFDKTFMGIDGYRFVIS